MTEVAYLSGLAVLLAGAGVFVRRGSRRRAALERIRESATGTSPALFGGENESLVHSRPLIPVAVGLATAVAIATLLGWSWPFAVSVAVLIGVVAHLGLAWLLRRRISRLEQQLADAVDLVVSAVRAGTGLVDALELAAGEIGQPMRGELEDLVARLRLGAEPRRALSALERRVPLETIQLLTFSLSVHWQSGSSLAGSLVSVATTIRDRIAVGRRMRAQSTEAQLSAVGVLTVTYLLALVTWRAEPERFVGFLGSSYGSFLVNATILLQALGLVWMARLTRVEV